MQEQETTTTNETILIEEETQEQEQQEETTTDLTNTYCNCGYSEQLETIIEYQANIYNDIHNASELFKTGFMICLVVFIMVIIYKFLKMFF